MQEPLLKDKKKTKIKTPQRIRNVSKVINKDEWTGLDLSSHGLKFISPCLFNLHLLKELYLQKNELSILPKEIAQLQNLEILDLSNNKLANIPPEMGKMIGLRCLKLNDNFLSFIPMELGTLYQLETLHIENNPLLEPFNSLYKSKGGLSLINYCRENNTSYPMVNDRIWMENINTSDTSGDLISVASYNILSPHYATPQLFGYVASWIIHWENRKEMIFQELVGYNFDILAIQEMETFTFLEYFKEQLDARCNYESLFYPSARSQSLPENQKMNVDGCATFWKRHKFSLRDQQCIKFADVVFNDPRFAKNDDIMNRNSGKDNIALISVLEKANGGFLIISNVHIHWNPEFSDVKLFQSLILLETIERFRQKYPTAGILLLGDFNSLRDSAVYEVISTGKINPNNLDFLFYNYTPYLKDGFQHNMALKDAYSDNEMEFSNFTAHFKGILDYIFFNEKLVLNSTLSPIDSDYCSKIVGLPSIHYPSDHIVLGAKFHFKGIRPKKKEQKAKIVSKM